MTYLSNLTCSACNLVGNIRDGVCDLCRVKTSVDTRGTLERLFVRGGAFEFWTTIAAITIFGVLVFGYGRLMQ